MKWLIRLLILVVIGGCAWIALTFYVDRKSTPYRVYQAVENPQGQVLILYHHDRIYDFGKRIGLSLAATAQKENWSSTLSTYSFDSMMGELNLSAFQKVVILTNVYNWRPDSEAMQWLEQNAAKLKQKKLSVFILGMGSTNEARQIAYLKAKNTGAVIGFTKSLWLWRPNDDLRLDDPNLQVADDVASDYLRNFLRQ